MARLVVSDGSVWAGKRVLVTGHTGFKGSWLCAHLLRLGARVSGVALAPPARSLFGDLGLAREMDSRFLDIRDAGAVERAIRDSDPEIVVHLAAQSLVRRGYREPVETYATNVMGTVHVLDALRRTAAVRAVVVVTTDKVYADAPLPGGYRETSALGGADPYAGSKAAAELVVATYRAAYFSGGRGPNVATARAGNVIGGGDYSEDRLLPDYVRAIETGTPLVLRRPDGIRPWQHVLDSLSGYLKLAERLTADEACASGWNFGPAESGMSVRHVVECFARAWDRSAESDVRVDPSPEHETSILEIDATMSRERLGWRNRWATPIAVARTAAWYRERRDGSAANLLVDRDILAYEAADQAPAATTV